MVFVVAWLRPVLGLGIWDWIIWSFLNLIFNRRVEAAFSGPKRMQGFRQHLRP